ncbi:hypothetical protein J4209_01825 [Candidatus Woesearchaeota archaeon]|nr:hypothetical protein [Candidatus Woesearchaeota archaeon]
MPTNIILKDETFFLLKMMAQEFGTESYDKTIRKLIREMKKPKESFFGKAKGLGEFKREEIDRFS